MTDDEAAAERRAPLIHPDGVHPGHDFEGWLDKLIRQARAAGVDDDRLLATLHDRADSLQDRLGGEPEGEP